jgi:hypothetical protein
VGPTLTASSCESPRPCAGLAEQYVFTSPTRQGVRRMASAVGASSELLAEAAQVASRVTTACPGHQAVVNVLGTRGLLRYRFDPYEDERRRQAHVGAIPNPQVLDLLLGLPIGISVPITSLTPLERSALRLAPSGAVAVDAGAVTRLAVHPLVVDLAVISARRWQSGLEIAGRFAPFCSRVLMLHSRPMDTEGLRSQADFYGIGVVVAHGTEVEVLVTPRPFIRRRFTAAGWQFVEEVYQQLI